MYTILKVVQITDNRVVFPVSSTLFSYRHTRIVRFGVAGSEFWQLRSHRINSIDHLDSSMSAHRG